MGDDQDPPILPHQPLLALHLLWDEWDSRISDAEERNYKCKPWFIRNLRNLKTRIENLSTKFSNKFSERELEIKKVELFKKTVFFQFSWLNAYNFDDEETKEMCLEPFADKIEELKSQLSEVQAELLMSYKRKLGLAKEEAKEESIQNCMEIQEAKATPEVETKPDSRFKLSAEAKANFNRQRSFEEDLKITRDMLKPPTKDVADDVPTEEKNPLELPSENLKQENIFDLPSESNAEQENDSQAKFLDEENFDDWTQDSYYEYYGYRDDESPV